MADKTHSTENTVTQLDVKKLLSTLSLHCMGLDEEKEGGKERETEKDTE